MTETHDDSIEAGWKLTKDLREAAATLSSKEARYLVDTYYQMQENRKRCANQMLALRESGEPHELVGWLYEHSRKLESAARSALDIYSRIDPLGEWARSIVGIGPVIAAGLLAHIDIEKCETAGAIWAFAGLDPTRRWWSSEATKALVRNVCGSGRGRVTDEQLQILSEQTKMPVDSILRATDGSRGKQKVAAALARRPWNARLKTLTWKIGESFVKVSGRDGDFYGHIYAERKAQEWGRNLTGKLSEQAEGMLQKKKIGKDTVAYRFYSGQISPKIIGRYVRSGTTIPMDLRPTEEGDEIPMLPPAHIQARAKRYAVKLFLAHYFEKGRELLNLPVPLPYPIAHQNHTHVIKRPTP